MIELKIVRDESTTDGVRGVLTGDDAGRGALRVQTQEEEWLNNIRSKSCIPVGRYRLVRVRRPVDKGGYETFEVTGVPNRSLIRFHPGMTEEDLEGCIAPGLQRGMVQVKQDEDTGKPNVKRGVLQSKPAFEQFMHHMGDAKEAWLTVEWAPGLPYTVITKPS